MKYEPYVWNAGDYYSGVRTTALAKATSLDTTIFLTNALTCSQVTLQVTLNGVVLGTKIINSGSGGSVPMSFTFAAITGPTYTLRYTNTVVVAGGCGNVQFTKDSSTVTLK